MSVVTSLMSQIPSLTFFNHEVLLITWQGSWNWNLQGIKNISTQIFYVCHWKFWNQATFHRKCMRKGVFYLFYDCHNYHFTFSVIAVVGRKHESYCWQKRTRNLWCFEFKYTYIMSKEAYLGKKRYLGWFRHKSSTFNQVLCTWIKVCSNLSGAFALTLHLNLVNQTSLFCYHVYQCWCVWPQWLS